MSGFGATSTADEVLEGHDLTGRTILVTGGYSGIGRETARAMGAKGAHVIIAGRDEAKLAETASELSDETGTSFETLACDLASLDSVRQAGAEARDRFDKIDVLINNAGVMACPKGETADGFERQFGTNHIGHFQLTKELMPLIENGSSQRIVNLSSRAHHRDGVHFDDPNYENREYEKWESYGQSKTANVLFTVALENRLADRGIHAYAVHPGGIQTNLGRHLSEQDVADLVAAIQRNEGGDFSFKTEAQGAATTCWAATSPELEGAGGVYCEDCHVADTDDEDRRGSVRSYAIDPDKAEKLWAMSEEMVGERFEI